MRVFPRGSTCQSVNMCVGRSTWCTYTAVTVSSVVVPFPSSLMAMETSCVCFLFVLWYGRNMCGGGCGVFTARIIHMEPNPPAT